jgi:predicted PurR-regulated permease PerM
MTTSEPGGRSDQNAVPGKTSIQNRAFLLLLTAVTVAFFWVMLPYYGAVFWAVILAILFRPLESWLEVRLGRRRNLSAALTVLAVIFVAILPVTIVLVALVDQGASFAEGIQSGEIAAPESFAALFDMMPGWMKNALETAGIDEFATLRGRFAEAITAASQFLASQALSVGQNTLRFVVSAGIMLYVLFFLFRDGPRIGAGIRSALPLDREVTDALVNRFGDVVRATVKGNLIIALIQGTIGGVTFWLLGIQGALLWGAIMVALSLLPAVGAAIVWVPVAVFLFLSEEYVRGVILVAVGVGVIGLVDNLLRPPLVGKGSRLPDYVVLVSTVGGLSVFGLNGFVIGPLIAALFVACWTLFRDARAQADTSG